MLAHFSKLTRTAMFSAMLTAQLAMMLAGATLATPVEARQSMVVAQSSQMTARQAAAQAKAIHGGKVLRVRKQGRDFKVRLLKESGRVVTVTVRG